MAKKTWTPGEKVNANDINGNFDDLYVNNSAFASKNLNTVYQAEANGFLFVTRSDGGSLTIYLEANSNPTAVLFDSANVTGFEVTTVPVKKGIYYKVTGTTPVVKWLPWNE